MMHKRLAIIGGGPAGMMAAIAARETDPACLVTLFERLDRVGKKLLATGNGRCNLTNKNALQAVEKDGLFLPVHYHGKHPDFALPALKSFPPQQLLSFFDRLGMPSRLEDTQYYPYSESAGTVLDLLRFYCETRQIRIQTGSPVLKLCKTKGQFEINGQYFDRCIVAAGGKASPHLGSDGSGYALLQQFGHKCTPLYPAITQIKTETQWVKQLKGIKCDAAVSIFLNGRLYQTQTGQLLFAEYGLSGPPVFQIARAVSAHPDKRAQIRIDFMPEHTDQQLYTRIRSVIVQPFTQSLRLDLLLAPLLHKRIGQVLIKSCGLSLQMPAADLTDKQISQIIQAIKGFTLTANGVNGFSTAQVTAGGIQTGGFDPATMQSKLQAGLFAAGEILDIDGDCGGFNLQWAFSSGRLAGRSAVLL